MVFLCILNIENFHVHHCLLRYNIFFQLIMNKRVIINPPTTTMRTSCEKQYLFSQKCFSAFFASKMPFLIPLRLSKTKIRFHVRSTSSKLNPTKRIFMLLYRNYISTGTTNSVVDKNIFSLFCYIRITSLIESNCCLNSSAPAQGLS